MGTQAAVGRSNNRISFQAGSQAARDAVAGLGGRRPSAMIAFATDGYVHKELLAGIREVSGPCAVVGCSAEGVITQNGSEESTYAAAVMAIASEEVGLHAAAFRDLTRDPARCGEAIARWASGITANPKLLLLFVDGLVSNVTSLLRAVEANLPAPVAICGGAAGDLLQFQRTWQYCGAEAFSDGVSALLITGDVETEIAVTHGCALLGVEHKVTRADDRHVYEIDGKDAWSVLKAYLPREAHGLDALAVAHIVIGERVPEDDAASASDFLVRVPIQLDRAKGALAFGAGIAQDTPIQMALRSAETVVERARAAVEAMRERRGGQRPLLVLQFDCACRGRLLFGEKTSEQLIDPIQQVLGKDVPWIGLHTYGEIGPRKERNYFQNYTAVFAALYPAKG